MEMELLNKRVERLLNEVRTLAVERARDAEGIECALRRVRCMTIALASGSRS